MSFARSCSWFLLAALAACRAAPSAAARGDGAVPFRFSPRPNRAAEIHWRTWSPAVFAAARQDHRPVLLSLAAVWCHWCHVLDETTLSDPRVIARINATTIPVRVDADQHPDVERRYLLGGWPTVALLDADGRVLDGGTYLLPETLLAMLARVVPAYTADPAGAFAALGGPVGGVRDEARPGALHPGDRAALTDSVLARLDPTDGGYVGGQRFPLAEVLAFALDRLEEGDARFQVPVRRWLDGMARGLADPVDGGFYRYATRPDWSAPHYEKMAVINAELIEDYARASRLFGDVRFAALARDAWRWAWTTLRHGDLFGASQDADEDYYAADAAGRARRPRPFVDPTTLADRNAELALGGLRAARSLGDATMAVQATTAGRAVLRTFVDADGVVAHLVRGGVRALVGDLADIGPMVDLAALLAVQGEPGAAARGVAIVAAARGALAAPGGGLYDRPAEEAPGIVRLRYRDAALNARYAQGVAALARATGDPGLRTHAREVVAAFAGVGLRPDPAAARFARARSTARLDEAPGTP